MGHDVKFFGMDDPKNEPSPDSDYWMPHIDFVELNRQKSAAAALQVLRRSIYSRDAARRIGELVQDWPVDVAHLHNIHSHLTVSVLVELHRRGIPVVWTLHDFKLLCPNTALAVRGAVCERCKPNRVLQCTLNRCKKDSLAASLVATIEAEVCKAVDPKRRVSRFVAPSEFIVSKFAEFGWDSSDFVHLPNFMPEERIPLAREPRDDRFVYTGRLDSGKGAHAVIEAVALLPNCKVDIAGEGPLSGELRSLADKIAPDRVTFHGRVGPAELAVLRDASLAVVVPSEEYENSPLAVTEAFGRGCPVIATTMGGLPELVQDGENGLLYTAGDYEALAQAMGRLASSTELQGRLSTGALATAQTLGLDAYLQRLLDVYGSVLG